MTTSIMKRTALGLFLAILAAPAWALSVSLTAPASGAVFQAGSTITLSASATPTNNNRPITKVEFFRGGTTLIGTSPSTSSPYSFAWTNVPAGSYTITAKVTDKSGATATSASRTIKVNAPPTVTLTAPVNGAVFAPGSTISLSATAADPDGTVLKVDFLQGTTLLGTDANSPYSFSWANVAAGSYVLTARATDNAGGVTASTAVSIVVDTPPAVSITSPASGAVLSAPASFTLSAAASDADGTIAKVDFSEFCLSGPGCIAGQMLLGTSASPPYGVSLANVAPGGHIYVATATDNNGVTTRSAQVVVTVNVPPTVSITSPASGAVFNSPASFTLAASAADSDGTVSKVDFFDGATFVGTATGAPGAAYTLSLTNVALGTHSYTAKATDNNAAVTTSAAVTATVSSPPVVAITAPADGSVLTAPASFTLSATASASNATIAKVDFYEFCVSGADCFCSSPSPCLLGERLLGTSTAPPYSLALANVALGGHGYVAAATDSHGVVGTSATVHVTVNSPPTVSITSPAAGATFTAPASITITATASDSDGTIVKVDFYQGTTLLGTATAAPYSFAWTNVASGSYSLTAVATDNQGGTTTSAAVSVTVNSAPVVAITAPVDGTVFPAPASYTLTALPRDTDGTITKVDFFEGTTLLGTVTAAPYSVPLTNVPSGTHTYTAQATDDKGAIGTSAPISVIVNSLPTVSITSPAAGATFTAPASITITADAADADGAVTSVAFYRDGVLISTVSAAPYTIAWTGVPVGTYSLTAVATDDRGAAATSAAVSVTVKSGVAQMYFIHPDHLNTPRAVSDATGTVVWKWDQTEPFGDSVPNNDPSGQGAFDMPLRFPGQYADRESRLGYNYFRDYDAALGRYVESDPIGVSGALARSGFKGATDANRVLVGPVNDGYEWAGLNLYSYAGETPLILRDPFGLQNQSGRITVIIGGVQPRPDLQPPPGISLPKIEPPALPPAPSDSEVVQEIVKGCFRTITGWICSSSERACPKPPPGSAPPAGGPRS